MSEDAALMREIARLTGSINNHKRQQAMQSGRGGHRGGYGEYSGARGGAYGGTSHGARGGSRGGFRGRSYYGSPHIAPYTSYPTRGFRGARGARSRGGRGANMSYTAPAVKFQTPCSDFTSTGNVENCKRWTNSGKCVHGLSCRYQHDPNHVALCKAVLHGKDCKDPMCTLSHDMNEHNAPLCTHFAKGHCTRDDCRFTHMANLANPPTGICLAFSVSGYCDNGSNCTKMHVFECPEFAETGKCTRVKCNLQHTLRANTHHNESNKSGAAPAPIKPQKIDISLLLEDIASDSEAESEQETQEAHLSESNTESGSESSSEEALNPEDFDKVEVDLPSDGDGGSFIHV